MYRYGRFAVIVLTFVLVVGPAVERPVAEPYPVEAIPIANGFYYYHDLGVDPAGWAHAYLDETSIDRLYYSTNAGGAWGAPVYINPTSDWGSINVSGAVDSQGRSHIAFDGGRAIDSFFHATNRSGSWQVQQVISDMRWYALDLGPEPEELPRAAYYDNYSGLNYAAMQPGGTWSHANVDNSGGVTTYAGRYPDLVVDDMDHGHIAYYYYVDSQIRYATNSSGSWAWFVVATDAGVQPKSYITRTPQGELLISYNINGRIWLARGEGGAWTHTAVTDPGSFGQSDVKCDAAGNAILVYNDSSADRLLLAMETGGGFEHYELRDHQAGGDGPVLQVCDEILHALAWDRTTEDVFYLTGPLYPAAVGGLSIAMPVSLQAHPSIVRSGEPLALHLVLPTARDARIALFDATGCRVWWMREAGFANGTLRFTWPERDACGRPLPAGVYQAVAETGGKRLQTRVVALR